MCVELQQGKIEDIGYVFCQLKVGDSMPRDWRIFIRATHGANSQLGRDWLNVFNYSFVSPNQKEGNEGIYEIPKRTTRTNKPNQMIQTNRRIKDFKLLRLVFTTIGTQMLNKPIGKTRGRVGSRRNSSPIRGRRWIKQRSDKVLWGPYLGTFRIFCLHFF